MNREEALRAAAEKAAWTSAHLPRILGPETSTFAQLLALFESIEQGGIRTMASQIARNSELWHRLVQGSNRLVRRGTNACPTTHLHARILLHGAKMARYSISKMPREARDQRDKRLNDAFCINSEPALEEEFERASKLATRAGLEIVQSLRRADGYAYRMLIGTVPQLAVIALEARALAFTSLIDHQDRDNEKIGKAALRPRKAIAYIEQDPSIARAFRRADDLQQLLDLTAHQIRSPFYRKDQARDFYLNLARIACFTLHTDIAAQILPILSALAKELDGSKTTWLQHHVTQMSRPR